MEALLCKKTGMTMWASCLADRSSKPDEVEVKRERLPLGDEGGYPLMGLFCVHPLRDEAETLPDPEDMSVDWKGFPPHAKKKETMGGLGADSFEISDGFLDLFGIHFLQKGEAQLPMVFLNPAEDFTDAPRLLIG